MFTGKLADAALAETAGVFNEVVEPEELEERTRVLAELLAANAPLVIQNGKEAIRRVQAFDKVPEGDDLVISSYLSEDFKEGVAAFMAKRKPVWKGK
jgi:enoyl-CoA hydratase/carnithine racemase